MQPGEEQENKKEDRIPKLNSHELPFHMHLNILHEYV